MLTEEIEMEEQYEEMMRAARQGDIAQVLRLLNAMPWLVGYQPQGTGTLLHWAAANGQKGMVKLLIRYGFQVDARDELGQTPLHLAAMRDLEMALLLIRAGAYLNARSKAGMTPLEIAYAMGQFRGVRVTEPEAKSPAAPPASPQAASEQRHGFLRLVGEWMPESVKVRNGSL